MEILIAGCGYVGTALARELVTDGHEVWGLRRRVADLPSGVRPVAADLTDASTLRRLPRRVDAVVYTASADTSEDGAYREAYVAGPRNLLRALDDGGAAPRRILFTSSTAVYGQADGEWVDEESATRPEGFRGRRLLEAEAIIGGGPWPSTVVRLGGIYGPRRDRLLRQVAEGRARRTARPVFTNRIHRDDAAGILHHLLLRDRPASLYLGVDTEPVDLAELVAWLARELGLPEPPLDADPEASRPRGSNKRCSSARLQASGYPFRFPTYREGYRRLIRGG